MNRFGVQEAITRLVLDNASTAAKRRIREEGRFSKQSDREVVARAVGNFLNSFTIRKNEVY